MIEKFKFWCQKILPLVYDDSLSYYEVLCKLAHKVNDVIEYCNTLGEYVKNYFKNLDLKSEVSEKIDNMGENGELQRYLDAYMLKGKRCVFFGDSITWGGSGDSSQPRVEYPYPDIIASKAGCESINASRSSATLAVLKNSTNNLKNQIETTNLDNVDYAFLCFGVNDFHQNVAIGSPDSTDWGCIYGALNNAIRAINTKNNNIEIVIISVPPTDHILARKGNKWSFNMFTYVEAIENFCLNNHIKYIDLLHNSGIDVLNHDYYSLDGTHLTQEGNYLVAECILYNLGGNTPFFYDGENVWDNMQYPSTQSVGNYSIIQDGVTNGYTSFNEIAFTPGLYVMEFDYYSDCDPYNMVDAFVGANFRVGNTNIITPVGVVNGSHRLRGIFKLTEFLSGRLTIRPFFETTIDVTVNNFSINNVKLIPITGSVVFNDVIDMTSDVFTGTASVTRYKSGIINVTVNGTLTANVSKYSAIVTSAAMRKLINESLQRYFPVYINDGVARGQLTNSGFALNQDLTSGATINFTVSY